LSPSVQAVITNCLFCGKLSLCRNERYEKMRKKNKKLFIEKQFSLSSITKWLGNVLRKKRNRCSDTTGFWEIILLEPVFWQAQDWNHFASLNADDVLTCWRLMIFWCYAEVPCCLSVRIKITSALSDVSNEPGGSSFADSSLTSKPRMHVTAYVATLGKLLHFVGHSFEKELAYEACVLAQTLMELELFGSRLASLRKMFQNMFTLSVRDYAIFSGISFCCHIL